MKINIKDTGIPKGLIDITKQLPNPSRVEDVSDFTLYFPRGEFIYMTGLVLLAAWRKALPAGVKVHVDDTACSSEAQSFLTNTGFREVIDTGHEVPSVQKRIGRVPLQPITNQFSKEATVNEIVSIFDEYSGHVENNEPFKVMVSELCENVLTHSESTSPGYVCARVLTHSETVEIAIADSGVGIRQSYINGTNEDVKKRLKKGASALELALDGLNSSKPTAPSGSYRSYYGFGLLVTRRLVEENRGQIFLMSEEESLYLNRLRRHANKLIRPYMGTFIGIVLDLNNPLPLEEIYEKAAEEYTGYSHRHERLSSTLAVKAVSVKQKQTEEVGQSDTVTPHISDTAEELLQVKKIELRHYGTELLTRDAGTAIRADIAGYLAAGNTVEVSLDDVTDITPSVADEAFAKLAQVVGQDVFEKRVHIVGGTRLANRLISFVLKTRGKN